MSNYVRQPIDFPMLNLRVVASGFEHAGEENTITLSRPQPADPTIKTILTSGSIRIEYPDTDTPPTLYKHVSGVWAAPVWLSQEFAVGKTKIKTVALEDNSEWQCVQPVGNYKITNMDDNLIEGQTLSVDTGVLIFVFGDNYEINGTSYSGFKIFAIQNSIAVISAIAPCRIVSFKAVPI